MATTVPELLMLSTMQCELKAAAPLCLPPPLPYMPLSLYFQQFRWKGSALAAERRHRPQGSRLGQQAWLAGAPFHPAKDDLAPGGERSER